MQEWPISIEVRHFQLGVNASLSTWRNWTYFMSHLRVLASNVEPFDKYSQLCLIKTLSGGLQKCSNHNNFEFQKLELERFFVRRFTKDLKLCSD